MLTLNNISKYYGSKKVLNNINLKFKDSGLVSIVGESGSGKSTLLSLIGALDKPTNGNIFFNKKDIFKDELNYHLNDVSFIFQEYNLIDYLSVYDNLSIIGKKKDILYYLKYFKMEGLKDKKVSLLSGGERQRVSIIRSLIKSSKILLCDEPTGALDEETGKLIMSLLKSISRKKLVIVVTHNNSFSEIYSDQIIYIKDGNISNISGKTYFNKIKKINNKISIKSIFTLAFNRYKQRRKRNILLILAFSIGLISLSIVLGISNGFKSSFDEAEKNELSKYPIIISKYMNDDLNINNNKEIDNNKIYINKSNHENIFTNEYINMINSLDKNLLTIKYDNYTYINNIDRLYEQTDLISGRLIKDSNEYLLLVDSNNMIDESTANLLNIKDESSFDKVINKKVDNKKIVGILKLKDNSNIIDLNGLISISEFNKDIYSIGIYPNNYVNKEYIINNLNKYKDITYLDYTSTLKSISITLMNGISTILIIFSFISLIISTIMIAIITYINVMERIHEIGLLKSLGIKNIYIKLIFYLENIFITFISSSLSIEVIYLLGIPINKIIYNYTSLNNVLSLDLKHKLIIYSLSIILSILASFIPIRKTNKLSIRDTLRYI